MIQAYRFFALSSGLLLALILTISGASAAEKPGISAYPALANFIAALEKVNHTDTGYMFNFYEKLQVPSHWEDNCAWVPVIPKNIAKRFYDISQALLIALPYEDTPPDEDILQARKDFAQLLAGSAYQICQKPWGEKLQLLLVRSYKGDEYNFVFLWRYGP